MRSRKGQALGTAWCDREWALRLLLSPNACELAHHLAPLPAQVQAYRSRVIAASSDG